MINENQETIEDVVAEMRLGVKDWKGERLGIFDCFANRIEAAAKREREAGAEAAQICGEIGEMLGMEAAKNESVTNCNRLGNAVKNQFRDATKTMPHEAVGNAAKMLEALQKIVLLTVKAGMSIRFEVACGIIAGTARCALSAPPRNCDKYRTLKEAEDAWNRLTIEDRCRYSFFIDKWLYAEAKGETKC